VTDPCESPGDELSPLPPRLNSLRLSPMRLALFYLLSGWALVYLAAQYTGPLRWMLLWPGVSLILVALAYAGLGARLLGKKSDGRVPAWAMALHFPVWWLRRLTSEPSRQLVAPGVWLGRRPRQGEVPDGVGLIVDMTAEFPRPRGARHVGYFCLPTLDGLAPRAKLFRQLVDSVLAADKEVYLCCAAGHGRSAAVAAAVMIARNQAADVDEAEHILRATRPAVALTRAQRRIVRRTTQGDESPQ